MLKKWFYTFMLIFTFCSCSNNVESTISDKTIKKNLLNKISDNAVSLEKRIYLIDSIHSNFNSKPFDSLDFLIVLKKSLLHFEREDLECFLRSNQFLIKKSQPLKLEYFRAKAYFNIGYYYDEVNRIADSAYYYYKLSNDAYLKIGDSSQIGSNTVNMAMLLRSNGDYFRSKELLVESLKFLDINKDKLFVASVYDQLGVNNVKLLNNIEAIKYHRKAIATSDSKNNILSYKNNLAVAFMESKNYEKAINILEEILFDKLLKEKSVRYARVLDNLTYCQWKKNNDLPVDDFLVSLRIRKEKNDRIGLISSYTNLAEYYLNKNTKKSKEYLHLLTVLAKELKVPKAEIDALDFLMRLEPNNILAKDRYIFLKDSLYKQELKVKTQFAMMEYNSQQEKERLLALEAETAKQETQLAQQKAQKVIFLSLSTLLLMLGTSFYFVLQQRHKKEKFKEVYNTEKRISQELHDGLANDVFGLMTRIQNKKNTPEEVLHSLDTIYETTRQISHKNSAINTGNAFKYELLHLIETYQDDNTTILTKGFHTVEWSILNEEKCIALHRSLKEILVNLKKHAKATLVSLQFEKKKNRIKITYSDNGIGFSNTEGKGIGLTHINSRMQSIGGQFTIFETIEKGVKMEIILT